MSKYEEALKNLSCDVSKLCKEMGWEMDSKDIEIMKELIKEKSDLEAKLADMEQEQIKEMQEHQEAMELADKTIKNLVEDNRASQEWYKKQLEESESRFQAHKQNDARIIQDQTDLIENLKQQLAESKEFLVATKWNVQDLNKQLADTEEQNKRVLEKLELIVSANQELEQKLAESEEKCDEFKQAISKCSGELPPNVAFDIANDDIRYQIVCNLTDRNQEHRKTIRELKQQLAEKEKEYQSFKKIADENVNYLKNRILEETRNYTQDKISFAVEQLEKVKNRIESKVESVYKRLDDLNIKIVCESTSRQLSTYEEIVKEIDNQIKAIKGREVV